MPALRRLLLFAAVAAALSPMLASPAHAESTAAAAPNGTVSAAYAARSVDFYLKNDTDLTLYRWWYNLPHGAWVTFPPETISPWTWAYWRSESDGAATGTQGSVTYSSAAGDVYLYWNNPYYGSNSFRCTAPAGYVCTGVPGSGDGKNPTPTFYLHRR